MFGKRLLPGRRPSAPGAQPLTLKTHPALERPLTFELPLGASTHRHPRGRPGDGGWAPPGEADPPSCHPPTFSAFRFISLDQGCLSASLTTRRGRCQINISRSKQTNRQTNTVGSYFRWEKRVGGPVGLTPAPCGGRVLSEGNTARRARGSETLADE